MVKEIESKNVLGYKDAQKTLYTPDSLDSDELGRAEKKRRKKERRKRSMRSSLISTRQRESCSPN